MTFRKQDIFSIRTAKSGIAFSPLLEWYLAAVWAGYKEHEFVDLPTPQQARIVAAYRCIQQIEAVVTQERARDAKRQNRSQQQQRKK